MIDFDDQPLGSGGVNFTEDGFDLRGLNLDLQGLSPVVAIAGPGYFSPSGPENGSARYSSSSSQKNILSVTQSDNSAFSL